MKTFKSLLEEFLGEETKHEPIYHNKKMAVETPTFSGHAHFKFSKELGKHGNHEYRVTYKGKVKHRNGGESQETSGDSHRMIVHNGDNGKPFKHDMLGASSKSLKDLVHKRAPQLIGIEDLK